MFWYDDTFYIFADEPNRVAFIADGTSDIANLPTTTTPGVPQGADNVSFEPVTAGSVVFIISTSDVYMLDSTDTWVKQPKRDSGGGGASSFSDLEDVSFENLENNQVPAWDAEHEVWINKSMEAVVTVDYENVTDKPTINGVELDGDLTSEDLGINNITEEQLEDLLSLI